jgi:hypothetical protein
MERMMRAPRAVYSATGLRLGIVIDGGKHSYQCWLLNENNVRDRLRKHHRISDVATWEPELFWNAHYYKLVPKV